MEGQSEGGGCATCEGDRGSVMWASLLGGDGTGAVAEFMDVCRKGSLE